MTNTTFSVRTYNPATDRIGRSHVVAASVEQAVAKASKKLKAGAVIEAVFATETDGRDTWSVGENLI